MRSIRSEWWQRARSGHPQFDEAALDPERALIALEELDLINGLFADDIVALQIITALGEGHTAEEIRRKRNLSQTDYDSARKRIRRVFLKQGLTMMVKPR